MFSNKLRTLFTLMLVLLLACSFTVFANAEESNDVSDTSVTSEASTDASDATSTDDSSVADTTSDTSDVTSTESVAATESTTEESSATEEAGSAWTGWIIAGAVIIILALGIFVAIKRNTSLGQRLVKMFKDYKSEIKKIVWLSRKETIRQTGIVLVIIVIGCVFLGLLDYGFTQLIQLI